MENVTMNFLDITTLIKLNFGDSDEYVIKMR